MNDCRFILLLCTVAALDAGTSEFVWLRDLNNDAHRRHLDLGLSEELRFQLNSGEKLINLHLKENPHIRADTDMYVVKELPDGSKRAVKEPVAGNDESKYYHDMDNVAAFTVRCVRRANGPCTRTLEGSLIIGDKYFHIAPVSDLSNVDRLYMNREYQDTPHVIREEMANDDDFRLTNDTINPNVSEDAMKKRLSVNLRRSVGNLNFEKGDFDHNKRAKTVYGVELHVVVDPPVWQKFYALADEDNENAMNRVKEYVSQVINGVALTFKSIQGRTFAIEITLKAITVLKNEADGLYETAKLFEKKGMVSIGGGNYLRAFKDWVVDTPGMPSRSDYDHAMMLTGYNLVDFTGIAFIGTVCSRGGISVVSEEGYFNTMIVASHELAHSLGAKHDDVVGCPKGNIMWMNLPNAANEYSHKSWEFSKCSIDAFSNTLAEKSCVKDVATFYNKEDYDNYNKFYPGQIYSAEAQCKIAFGPGSRRCSIPTPDKICVALSCYNPRKQICNSQVAADGTQCGTENKWCIDGQCVSKPSGVTTPKPTTTTVNGKKTPTPKSSTTTVNGKKTPTPKSTTTTVNGKKTPTPKSTTTTVNGKKTPTPKSTTTTVNGKKTPTPKSTTTTVHPPSCKDSDVCQELYEVYNHKKRFCSDLGEVCCEMCKGETKCEDIGYMDWSCADIRSFYSTKSKFCSKWSVDCCMSCSK